MRAERSLRRRLLNRILGHYQMRLSPWSGDGYLVSGTGQPTELVDNLADLWAAVERAGGIKCDPLDPDLLSSLQPDGREYH